MNNRYIFILAIFILCTLLYSSSNAQNKKEYNLFSVGDNSSLITSPELINVISDAVILNVDKVELQNLYDNKNPEISLTIPYYQGRSARLNLKRFDVLAPNAKIIARTSSGNEEVALTDIVVSYTGKVEGFENTLVTINFTKDNIIGMMTTSEDNYIIGALKDNNGQRTDNYILYKESNLKVKNTFNCSTSDEISTEEIDKMRKIIMNKMKDSSPTDLYVAEIAIDIDYATFNIYGASVQNATNYVLALMSSVSAIYMKEVNVRLIIPYLRVWITPDPYTGITSNAILNQFRNEWNANQQAVQRTLAHLISRRSGGLGGIAWVNVLCADPSFGNGYAFSNTDGPILPLPTYSWDVMVVAHETGHNFGSLHTHNCGWPGGPIDSCYATEGGCYTGPAIPRVGTIMSYCHLNGSISLIQGFGPLPRELVRSRAENASCMYISGRDLVVAYPNGGETFRTGNSAQIYWGTSLTGNINIELSLNNGSTWQTIQNNVPATQRVYDWIIPNVPTALQTKIRMLNSSNPNIGDTCDAAFRIVLTLNVFNPISPPTFTRIEVSPMNFDIQKFIWSRAGTDPSIRYKFKIRKIGTSLDYSYPSDNNGTDTTISIRKSFLDSLAQTLGTTGDSVRCSWRGWAYNGFDSSSSANTFIVTFLRTTVGINVISSVIPDKYSLGNNYPNPFNPATNIKFDIPELTFVELSIFDSRGSEVNKLLSERLHPGSYEYNWNAINFPSGVYFYRLKTSEFMETKRMILIK